MPNLPATSAGPRRLSAVLAATAVVGVQVWGSGPVAADSGAATLRFTCTVASLPSQTVTVRLKWTVPDSVVVGRPTPPLPVEAGTTLSAAVTDGAGIFGVAGVEGRVDASAVVAAPEGDIAVDLPLTVPPTDVPDSGPMTVVATGTIPGRVFHRPGHATVTIGGGFVVSADLKDAGGGPPRHVDASCVLDPGQDAVLATFEIMAGEQAQGGAVAQTAEGPPATKTPPPATGLRASRPVTLARGGSREATAGAVSPTAAAVAAGGVAGWWLPTGAVLVVGACGCAWWLVRRRRG